MNDWNVSQEEEKLIEALLQEEFEAHRLSYAKKMAILKKVTGAQPWWKALFDKMDISDFLGGKKFLMPLTALTVFLVVVGSGYVYFAPLSNLEFGSSLREEERGDKFIPGEIDPEDSNSEVDFGQEQVKKTPANQSSKSVDSSSSQSSSSSVSGSSSSSSQSSSKTQQSTKQKSSSQEPESSGASGSSTQKVEQAEQTTTGSQSQSQIQSESQAEMQFEAPTQFDAPTQFEEPAQEQNVPVRNSLDLGQDEAEGESVEEETGENEEESEDDAESPYYYYQFDSKILEPEYIPPACTNQCEMGAIRCDEKNIYQFEYCGDSDKNGCTEWSELRYCKDGYYCKDNTCVKKSY